MDIQETAVAAILQQQLREEEEYICDDNDMMSTMKEENIQQWNKLMESYCRPMSVFISKKLLILCETG